METVRCALLEVLFDCLNRTKRVNVTIHECSTLVSIHECSTLVSIQKAVFISSHVIQSL